MSHTKFSDEITKENTRHKQIPLKNLLTNSKPLSVDSNEYAINSQILSSITEISSYNSYGDYEMSKTTTQNESEIREKTHNSEQKRKNKPKNVTSFLEAIVKNSHFKNKLQENICRICLYDASFLYNGPLITPCKCRNNLKYIHEECLKTILLLKKRNIHETFCESCKSRIISKIEYENVFFPKKIFRNSMIPFIKTFFLFISLLCLLLQLIIFIFFIEIDFGFLDLQEENVSTNKNKNKNAYFIVLIFFVWISFLVFISMAFAKNFKNSFYIKKIKSWTFENYSPIEQNKKEEEEIKENCLAKWCPINFILIMKKNEISNKIQEKYEISIIEKKEFEIINEPTPPIVLPKEEVFVHLEEKFGDINNIESAKFNNNFSYTPAPESHHDSQKKPQKFNFTFRNNETFLKPILFHDENKDNAPIKIDTTKNISNSLDNTFNKNENLIAINENENKSFEIPIRTRNIIPWKNTFQKGIKKISKEKTLKDIESFQKTLNKDFINFDSSKHLKFKIMLTIYAYSLQYIKELQQEKPENKDSQINNLVKSERNSQQTGTSHRNSNKKKPLCLKKKRDQIYN